MSGGLRSTGLMILLVIPTALTAQTFDQGPVTVRDFQAPAMQPERAHPVETGNLFGFTLGSDTDDAGARGLMLETTGAFGRRDGRYRAGNAKLQLSYGVTDDLSLSFGVLGGAWNISGSPDLPDTNAIRFRGFGGEVRWRLLERGPERFGVTFHVEPSITLADDVTGQAGTGYASENKINVDTMFSHDQVWAALNLVYDVESFRPWSGGPTEDGSVAGVTGAVTARLSGSVFFGAELRYLYAFNGLTMGRQVGRALYLGPTAYWRVAENAALSAAWNIQVAGHASDDSRRLDLTNFSRHLVRLKLIHEF